MDTLTTLRTALGQINKDLERWAAAKISLEKILGVGEAAPRKKVVKAKRAKAPTGALSKAVEGVFRPGVPMTNAEVRKALKSQSYPYSVSSENVRQALKALGKEGKVSYNKENFSYQLT